MLSIRGGPFYNTNGKRSSSLSPWPLCRRINSFPRLHRCQLKQLPARRDIHTNCHTLIYTCTCTCSHISKSCQLHIISFVSVSMVEHLSRIFMRLDEAGSHGPPFAGSLWRARTPQTAERCRPGKTCEPIQKLRAHAHVKGARCMVHMCRTAIRDEQNCA